MRSRLSPRRAGFATSGKNIGGASRQEERPHQQANRINAMNSTLTGHADQLFNALSAKAATVSCSLYPLVDGYLITKQAWGLSRQVPDLRAVAALLKMMGAH